MRHLILAIALTSAPAWADEITPDLIADLPPVDILYLGELHDNPWHHETQAKVVSALAPSAVVFEMVTPEVAEGVSGALLTDKTALRAALDWDNSGWPSFDMYYPIFAASAGAKVYGAQVPRADVRAAIMGEDIAKGFGDGAAQFGLLDDLPMEEQQARESKQFEAHCNALPESMLPGMVLGQRLRDATLAREITRAHMETGGPVIVITGNGHARLDWGAPRLVSADLSQRSIAQLEHQPEESVPYDFFVVTQAAEREDPCNAFKKN
ncbi:ChaN family lipoprotein [Shimia thalassica]|uniref:ChaN family lipoprotein n=1 Tax=Shimia thalassica TaxID=1715693 RepID=UPI0026E46CC2|nr:ChaN family lipoprotein [Shimia thalassica]MDO6481294.1 ChaN family lipoprotein [Shimia thalassica]